jgi:tetratricopeptide (TPR) repeat protein
MNETLSPHQLASEGKTSYQKGDYLGAANAFEAAALGYTAAGDTLNAAEMANNRSVALLQAGDPEGALQAVEGTDIIFYSYGDGRRQGMALANHAAALEALGKLDEGINDYEAAADIFKQIGEHQLRAPLMQSLATLQLRTGRHLQGLATMESGLEEAEKPSTSQSLLKRLLRFPLRWLGL